MYDSITPTPGAGVEASSSSATPFPPAPVNAGVEASSSSAPPVSPAPNAPEEMPITTAEYDDDQLDQFLGYDLSGDDE